MSTQSVLLELIEDNTRRVHELLETSEEDCLYWEPDEEATSIAVIIWHVARVFDVFMHQNILDKPSDAEIWFASGWSARTGYDPRGSGSHGWGMLTGYTVEQVKAIPRMSRDVLKGYYDEALQSVVTYVKDTPEDTLMLLSLGFNGTRTNYFWVRHPLFDLTRHVGEMLAIKAMWQRRQS